MTKQAFTLAEVLITLGIIGVVASMTLPALIQTNKNAEVESKLKKSIFCNESGYIKIRNR